MLNIILVFSLTIFVVAIDKVEINDIEFSSIIDMISNDYIELNDELNRFKDHIN